MDTVVSESLKINKFVLRISLYPSNAAKVKDYQRVYDFQVLSPRKWESEESLRIMRCDSGGVSGHPDRRYLKIRKCAEKGADLPGSTLHCF